MKLNLKVRSGGKARQHLLELPFESEAFGAAQGKLRVTIDGESRQADWAVISAGAYSILIDGRSFEARLRNESSSPSSACDVTVGGRSFRVEVEDPRRPRYAAQAIAAEGPQEILAPMPGRIVKVLVAENQEVAPGEGLLVIEAMKMQNELRAPRPGRVEKIYVGEGTGVESGVKLLRLV